MTDENRDELRKAAELLSEARESVSDADAADSLETYAEQVERLAEADRGPDHGRLDRIMYNLGEIEEELDGEAAETVESAYSHVRAYRETVEGV